MKSLRISFLFVLVLTILSGMAQSIADKNDDKSLLWIKSILNDRNKSIDNSQYLFYYTGHHGIIWSMVLSDSSGIHFFNGTTRKPIEKPEQYSFDTIAFVKDNLKTITWGLDSLADAAKLVTQTKDHTYNPIYNVLYVVKDNKRIFTLDNNGNFSGPDGVEFNIKLKKLLYLMFWLAAPDCRSYAPIQSLGACNPQSEPVVAGL